MAHLFHSSAATVPVDNEEEAAESTSPVETGVSTPPTAATAGAGIIVEKKKSFLYRQRRSIDGGSRAAFAEAAGKRRRHSSLNDAVGTVATAVTKAWDQLPTVLGNNNAEEHEDREFGLALDALTSVDGQHFMKKDEPGGINPSRDLLTAYVAQDVAVENTILLHRLSATATGDSQSAQRLPPIRSKQNEQKLPPINLKGLQNGESSRRGAEVMSDSDELTSSDVEKEERHSQLQETTVASAGAPAVDVAVCIDSSSEDEVPQIEHDAPPLLSIAVSDEEVHANGIVTDDAEVPSRVQFSDDLEAPPTAAVTPVEGEKTELVSAMSSAKGEHVKAARTKLKKAVVVARQSSDEIDLSSVNKKLEAEGHVPVNERQAKLLNKVATAIQTQTSQETLAGDVAAEVNMLTKVDSMDTETKSGLLIHHNSPTKLKWDFLMVFLILYISVVVPIDIGFKPKARETHSPFDMFLELAFIVDVFINFITTYADRDTKEEISDIHKIRSRYIRTWFIPDFISSMPVTSLSFLTGKPLKSMQTFRIIRILKLFHMSNVSTKIIKKLEETISFNPAVYRVTTFFIIFSLIQHFLASAYWYISRTTNFESTWTPDVEVYEDAPLKDQYAKAIAFSLAVTFGNDMAPTNLRENVFMCVSYLIALVVNAVIIGSAATLLSNMDTTAVAKKEQMDGINEYMRFRKVPPNLQKTIRSYYEYLWDSGQTSHNAALLKDMPNKLRLQLNVALKKRLIEKVPLFKTCSPAGIIALVQNLKSHIILPNELVIRQGEMAECMFFIARGSVRVYITQNGEEHYIITLHEGSFFGEIALTNFGSCRTANVRSISFCELHVLTRSDFVAILDTFPSFKLAVEMLAKSRLRTTDTLQAASKAAGKFGVQKQSRNNSRVDIPPPQNPKGGVRRQRSLFSTEGEAQDEKKQALAALYDKVLEEVDMSHASASSMAEGMGISRSHLMSNDDALGNTTRAPLTQRSMSRGDLNRKPSGGRLSGMF